MKKAASLSDESAEGVVSAADRGAALRREDDRPAAGVHLAGGGAAAVTAFPLVCQTAKAGFLSVHRDLEDAGRSIGASS